MGPGLLLLLLVRAPGSDPCRLPLGQLKQRFYPHLMEKRCYLSGVLSSGPLKTSNDSHVLAISMDEKV